MLNVQTEMLSSLNCHATEKFNWQDMQSTAKFLQLSVRFRREKMGFNTVAFARIASPFIAL